MICNVLDSNGYSHTTAIQKTTHFYRFSTVKFIQLSEQENKSWPKKHTTYFASKENKPWKMHIPSQTASVINVQLARLSTPHAYSQYYIWRVIKGKRGAERRKLLSFFFLNTRNPKILTNWTHSTKFYMTVRCNFEIGKATHQRNGTKS